MTKNVDVIRTRKGSYPSNIWSAHCHLSQFVKIHKIALLAVLMKTNEKYERDHKRKKEKEQKFSGFWPLMFIHDPWERKEEEEEQKGEVEIPLPPPLLLLHYKHKVLFFETKAREGLGRGLD